MKSPLDSRFSRWNDGVLESYLIEITADIFSARDDDGEPLVDKVLDAAGQKGTGKWTGINALELGMPLTLITEAVYARCLSALKESREHAATVLQGTRTALEGDRDGLLTDIHDALYAAKISAVSPLVFVASTAAPAPSRARTAPVCP